MAEGQLCVMCAAVRDAEVAFGDDKSDADRDAEMVCDHDKNPHSSLILSFPKGN